jgi:hypothetical protein
MPVVLNDQNSLAFAVFQRSPISESIGMQCQYPCRPLLTPASQAPRDVGRHRNMDNGSSCRQHIEAGILVVAEMTNSAKLMCNQYTGHTVQRHQVVLGCYSTKCGRISYPQLECQRETVGLVKMLRKLSPQLLNTLANEVLVRDLPLSLETRDTLGPKIPTDPCRLQTTRISAKQNVPQKPVDTGTGVGLAGGDTDP